MKITQQVLTIHQMTLEEFNALELAEKVIRHIQDSYGEDCVLMSPNDGEIIQIEELSRVTSVLSFIMRNRVVEVNP
jgi:DNA-binding IclR family transcriptional regulator